MTRFSRIAINKANQYKPKIGDNSTWVADETVIGIAGVKGQKIWLWDVIDADTRFLLATHMSLTRTTKDAQILMQKAYERAGKAPKTVVTDKLAVYLDGIERVFGADSKHVQSTPFIDNDSTNLIERFPGTLKDRTKVMRGFKKVVSAQLILDGWVTYYNFFRTHESLGDKTPAEVAGIDFPYKTWRDVVESQSYPTRQDYPTDIRVAPIPPRKQRQRRYKQRREIRSKVTEVSRTRW